MNLTWFIIRASGIVAFASLALSTIWGLVLSTSLTQRAAPKKGLTLVHESLAVGSIIATIIHLVFLYLDEFVEFSVEALLVPGVATWKPLPVALGIAALYGMLLVTVSFYLRGRIGQQYWRAIHYLSFGVFVGALLHGLLAGTDTANPYVAGMYGAAAMAVIGLTAVRVLLTVKGGGAAPRARNATEPRTRPAVESAGTAKPAARDRAAMLAAARAAAAGEPQDPA